MNNKYYYAKIGKGNKYASQYLRGENEIKLPAIVIDFNNTESDNWRTEEEFLKNGKSKEQGRNFFECGNNNSEKYIVVIHDGLVRLLMPAGNVVFKESEYPEGFSGIVKLLPVKELKALSITEVPAILASIAANRYYSSGTFREIKNPGNIIAIKTSLSQEIAVPPEGSIKDALICLSSFEFETLIAKIFEEAGCFVPAYRGGNMQGADLFARNETKRPINIAGLSIDLGKRISIQVKLKSELTVPPQGVNILIAIETEESEECLGLTWLGNALNQSPKTLKWLRQSLSWLPLEFFNKTLCVGLQTC